MRSYESASYILEICNFFLNNAASTLVKYSYKKQWLSIKKSIYLNKHLQKKKFKSHEKITNIAVINHSHTSPFTSFGSLSSQCYVVASDSEDTNFTADKPKK